MKRIYRVALTILVIVYVAPMDGMFARLRQSFVREKPQMGVRGFSSKVTSAGAKVIKGDKSAGRMATLQAQVTRFLSDLYARLWKRESTVPLQQKKLSVPVIQTKEDIFEEQFFDKTNIEKIIMYRPEHVCSMLPENREKMMHVIEKMYTNLSHFYYEKGTPGYTNILLITKAIAEKAVKDLTVDDLKALTVRLSLVPSGAGPIHYARNMVDELILIKPELKKYLVQYMKKNRELYKRSGGGIRYLAKFFSGPDFIEAVLGIGNSYAETPSYRHLEKFYAESGLDGIDLTPIGKNQNLKVMVQKLVTKEKELTELGYEVFYHARRGRHKMPTAIYSMLYEYTFGVELKDYIFPHLSKPILSQEFLESQRAKRKRLMDEGNPFHLMSQTRIDVDPDTPAYSLLSMENRMGFENRQALLFLNKFLFGNFTRKFTSSIQYFLMNINMEDIDISIHKVFNMFGYDDIYLRYEKELLELQKRYLALSKYGEMLQIAIPKNIVDKCIYYTAPEGRKIEFDIPGVGKTTDIKKILEYVKQNPQDQMEFVLVVTADEYGGNNAKSGIKIFSYDGADPIEEAALSEELKQLFVDKILPACREQDEEKKQEAIQQEKAKLASE